MKLKDPLRGIINRQIIRVNQPKVPIKEIPLEITARNIVSRLTECGLKLSETDISLVRKIVFANVDITRPESEYHLHVIASLFHKIQKDGLPHSRLKTIYDIARKMGIKFASIKEIKVDHVKLEDISLDLGTQRDVDRITFVLEDGEKSFTVSLDKRPFFSPYDSHSKQEAEVLIRHNIGSGMWAVQQCYGFSTIDIKGKKHAVIFKEYLPGTMLGNYTEIIGTIYEEEFGPALRMLARSHGQMIGNIYARTDAFPQDMNPLNVIVDTENEKIKCRTCDICGLVWDQDKGLRLLMQDIQLWGKFAYYYLFGFFMETNNMQREIMLSNIESKLGDKIKDPSLLTRLRNSVQQMIEISKQIISARGFNDEAKMEIAAALENIFNHELPPIKPRQG